MRRAGTKIVGGLSITNQLFTEVGEVLKVHTHKRDYVTHITIVAKGSVKLLGSRDGEILNEGDITNWGVDEPHGFIAVTVPVLIYNIRKAQDQEKEWPDQEVGTRIPCPCQKDSANGR